MTRPAAQPSDRAAPAGAWFALAAVSLGQALQIADGFYSPLALALVTAAIVCCAAGVAIPDATRAAVPILGCGIALQLIELSIATPGMYLRPDAALLPFRAGVALEAVAIGAAFFRPPLARWLWFPALIAIHLMLGWWTIVASPEPRIDVVTVHRAAIRALVHGRNPYRITFQNIYGAGAPFYNPALVQGDRVLFGYPYPPLTLLLAVPGQVCCGDYRYAQVAATAAGAAAIAYSGAGLAAPLAAALLLTTPRMFFVIEQGWSEPIGIMLLGALLWSMRRRPGLAAWASGLLIATKQYFVLALPLLVRFALADRRSTVRFIVRLSIAGAIVTLPFLLWSPRAFVDTVLLLQAREPFRIDSLSYASWAARVGWGQASIFWSLAAGLFALGVAMAATRNTAGGFFAALSLSLLTTFAFGSKAFCNYYFLVIGSLCCAAAASSEARAEPR